MKIKYLHTMVRVKNIEKSKEFYCDLLGLYEIRRKESALAQISLGSRICLESAAESGEA